MAMATNMLVKRFTPDWQSEGPAKRAYEQHNADVRASVPADRLIDYRTGDGWAPICDKLGLPVPSEPFPHVNSTDEFRDDGNAPALTYFDRAQHLDAVELEHADGVASEHFVGDVVVEVGEHLLDVLVRVRPRRVGVRIVGLETDVASPTSDNECKP